MNFKLLSEIILVLVCKQHVLCLNNNSVCSLDLRTDFFLHSQRTHLSSEGFCQVRLRHTVEKSPRSTYSASLPVLLLENLVNPHSSLATAHTGLYFHHSRCQCLCFSPLRPKQSNSRRNHVHSTACCVGERVSGRFGCEGYGNTESSLHSDTIQDMQGVLDWQQQLEARGIRLLLASPSEQVMEICTLAGLFDRIGKGPTSLAFIPARALPSSQNPMTLSRCSCV